MAIGVQPSLRKKNRFVARDAIMLLFVLPATLLYILFFVYPVIQGAYFSLTDWNGLTSKFKFVGLKNFGNILHDTRFLKAFWFNIRYSVLLIISITVLAVVLALLLNNKFRGRSFFRGLYFFPAVISLLTAGLIFNEIFFRALPPLGEMLNISWLKTSLLSSPKTAIYGILAVNVWQGVAIPTVLVLAALQSIPGELMESASLDGANAWQRFRAITIPFILPILSVVLVLTLKDGLTVFDYIVSLTSGGPGGSTESVSLLIYNHGFKEMKFSYGIAEALILCLVVCTISFFQISYTNKKKVY